MYFKDIRYALRGLWHAKGFTAVAVLCLGLGIGLNTTIFSVVDGVLLKPFPYDDPDRIVQLTSVNRQVGVSNGALSYLDLRDAREASTTLVRMAGAQTRSLTISDTGSDPERYLGSAISWELFPLLGVEPVLGSGFTADHDRPGGGGVVLIGHDVWMLRYQGDPGIVGRRILVNAEPMVVVGVMPEGFEFPENQKLWIPLAPVGADSPRNGRGIFSLGRLAPDATLDQARSELATIGDGLAATYPDTNRDWGLSARELRETLIPDDVSLVIWLMMAGVTLVLFIACSNVANLLLARASSRRREIAVRSSLGAGRGQIVRQLLTESVVLALVAVPLGVVLAILGSRLIFNAMPPDQVPYYIAWAVDGRSMAYAVAVAVTTAVLFGLFPALQATRGALHEDLKEGTRGNSARRSLLRSSLVVSQVSLALVALVGALMFVRSFVNLDSFDVGFDTRPVMTMRFYLPGEPYTGVDAKARRVEDILERVEALPGVEAAFSSNMVPVSGGGGGGNILIDGQPSEPGREPGIAFIGVTPHFAETLGLPILGGRTFTEAEGWSRSDVALVNQTMAQRFWPDSSPVGRRFRLVNPGLDQRWFTIIGVVGDILHDDVDPNERPDPTAYVSYSHQQTLNTGLTIRVAGDPASVTSAVRNEIREADPNLPVFQVATMEDVRRLGFWQYGLFGWVFGTIGGVGLLLASIGVYGVLSYAVSQRTQEIGVRMALGAVHRDVVKLIVGHGLLLAGIGVLVGLALAPLGTYASRSFFYEVSPFDPLTFGAVAVFLMAVAVLASYLPALRATRVDPLDALRQE